MDAGTLISYIAIGIGGLSILLTLFMMLEPR